MKSDPGLTGALGILVNAATLPDTADFEGGLSLGEGGDGSVAPVGFHEGIVIAGATSDATDNAIAANIAAFYKGVGTASQPAQTPAVEFATCAQGSSNSPCTGAGVQTKVPAGSLIIVLTFDASATPASDTLTDTQGNTYRMVAQQGTCNAGYGNGTYSIFYAYNALPLTTADNLTFTSASPSASSYDAAFVTGISHSGDPLDSSTIAKNSGSGGNVAITSGTPTQSGEFFAVVTAGGPSINIGALGWNNLFVSIFDNDWGLGGVLRDPAAVPFTYNLGNQGAAELVQYYRWLQNILSASDPARSGDRLGQLHWLFAVMLCNFVPQFADHARRTNRSQ